MKFPFDPGRGLIVIPTEVIGPTSSAIVQLALDTGATRSLINAHLLMSLGYDPALSLDRIQMTTGSGLEYVVRLEVIRMAALGRSVEHFPIIAHTLPPSATIDGLLGLDFLRDTRLVIDFQLGELALET
jgi:hypothetical protein